MTPRLPSERRPELSQQCSARSKRSGQRCRSSAIVGGMVCWHHGGAAPQTRAKAAQRIALADALGAAERRHPGEILLDALHVADVLGRGALAEVQSGGATVATVEGLVESIERAARLAKVTLDAGLAERQTQLAESQGAQLAAGLQWLLGELPEGHRPEVRRLLPMMLRGLAAGELPSSDVASGPAVIRAVTSS